MREPILHLAKRGARHPESLRAGEIKRLSERAVLAFRARQREASRLVGEEFARTVRVLENTENFLEDAK